jgi:hypothetical protein
VPWAYTRGAERAITKLATLKAIPTENGMLFAAIFLDIDEVVTMAP